jgi:anthranilate/para-aminobenzoate synthase component II
MVLVIDNYDSFTYNIVQYLGEMQVDLQVHRNDQISIDQIRQLNPERILVSPGPCSPRESGLSNEVIRTFGPTIPLMGVCLGHQCIGHTFGAQVVVNYRMMHGKTSPIKHNGRDLFEGMPNPFLAPAITLSSSSATPCPTASKSPPKPKKAKSWACAINNFQSGASNSTPKASLPKMAGRSLKTSSSSAKKPQNPSAHS